MYTQKSVSKSMIKNNKIKWQVHNIFFNKLGQLINSRGSISPIYFESFFIRYYKMIYKKIVVQVIKNISYFLYECFLISLTLNIWITQTQYI